VVFCAGLPNVGTVLLCYKTAQPYFYLHTGFRHIHVVQSGWLLEESLPQRQFEQSRLEIRRYRKIYRQLLPLYFLPRSVHFNQGRPCAYGQY